MGDIAGPLEDQLQKNVSLQSASPANGSPMPTGREAGDWSHLLTERELEEIRQGVRAGARGAIVLAWLERLLADHDERVRRDRALAVRLLSGVDLAGAAAAQSRAAAARP